MGSQSEDEGLGIERSYAASPPMQNIANQNANKMEAKKAEVAAQAAEEQQMRYQTIMRQLEILGVRDPKIAQLHRQLHNALGDDSGRKLAVLHKAIKSLVQTINIPELSEAPRREITPVQRSIPEKRTVIEYSALTGPGKWLNKEDNDEKQGPHKRPWRGDQQEVMWNGQYNKAQHVIEGLFSGQRGRPMLSAAVGVPKPDFIGDTILDQDDKVTEPIVKEREDFDKDEELNDDLPIPSRDRIPGANLAINHIDQVRTDLHAQTHTHTYVNLAMQPIGQVRTCVCVYTHTHTLTHTHTHIPHTHTC